MRKYVIKRDGSKEPFVPAKIARVVHAAGLTEEEAEKLAAEIAVWVDSLDEDEISSQEIRDEVTILLEEGYPKAHGLFVWYQQSKEKKLNNTS